MGEGPDAPLFYTQAFFSQLVAIDIGLHAGGSEDDDQLRRLGCLRARAGEQLLDGSFGQVVASGAHLRHDDSIMSNVSDAGTCSIIAEAR